MEDRKRYRAGSVAGIALGVLVAALPALNQAMAHAYLEVDESEAGKSYEAVINLPHGCDGAPTDTISIKIPDNLVVDQEPVTDGWTVTATRARFAEPKTVAGEPVTEGIVQVKWTGGSISDDEVGQVRIEGRIVDDLEAGTKLHFPTVQHCADKSQRWIEIQKPGQDLSDLEKPAPFLTIIDETMSAGAATGDKVDHSKHKTH